MIYHGTLFYGIHLVFISVNLESSDCSLNETEKRELILNKYVQDLVKLPEQVRTLEDHHHIS